jgi:hypothetical protein
MASAWNKKGSSRWFIGFMGFAGRDGKRKQLVVSVPESRARSRAEAVKLGDHLALCVRYLEGTDLQLEMMAGASPGDLPSTPSWSTAS